MKEGEVTALRFLVTGGSGFIGSNFIEKTLAHEDLTRLVNLDNLSSSANQTDFLALNVDSRYLFVECDINDESLLTRHVSEADMVINFAAQTHVDKSIAVPRPFLKSNTEGVFSILEAMRKSRGEPVLLQVSTDEVYGDIVTGSASEASPLKPSSPYAATKAAADLLCLAYRRTYGLRVRIARCCNNFGPRQFPEKLLPKAIIRAHLGLRVPIYGNGENIRDWIHVADHCDALAAVIHKGKDGEIYNISGHNEMKNADVVNLVLRIMGKPTTLVEHVGERPGHDKRYSMSDDKLRTVLGWRPKYAFKDALAATAKWYLENEEWWSPLADDSALSPSPWKGPSKLR